MKLVIYYSGFLLEKNLREGAKDNRPLFFKTLRYCFYCSFYRFFQKFKGGKSGGGAPPLPPCSRKPAIHIIGRQDGIFKTYECGICSFTSIILDLRH